MKTGTAGLFALLAFVVATADRSEAAGPADDPATMVRQADLSRGPDRPFTMKMEVIDRHGEEVITKTGVMVDVFDPGRSVVEFVYPKKDEGRKILRVAENMWIRIPSTKRAIRITPQQRLVGQVANGDVLSTNYTKDYSAKLLGDETITEPDGKQVKCKKLELVKKTEAATYYRMLYWLEASTFRPIRTEFYTQTGKLLKTAHFVNYGNFLGAARPSKILIVSSVVHEENSVIDIQQYGESKRPSSYYSESSLNQ
jgi:hypothetical protein